MFGKRKAQRDQAAAAGRGAWQALGELLDDVTAAPEDPQRWVDLALGWAAISKLTPTYRPPRGHPLMGFAPQPSGQVQDCAITERALTLIDALLAGGHDQARLLQARAGLLAGWQRYDEASTDLDRAATAVPADLPEAAQAAGLLRHHAAMLRAQIGNAAPATDEERAALAQAAAEVASSVVKIVPYAPPQVWLHPPTSPAVAPDPRLVALAAPLQAAGFRQLAWFENSWFNGMFGQRVLTAAWADPAGECVVAAGAVGAVEATDVETWLSDGRFLTTTASRGRNGFAGGPWEDTLQVDESLSLDDLIALHRSRLRMLLATTPGLTVAPVASGEAFAAMQEALRARKAEFRLAEGLSEAEARGIPLPHPDLAVPMLRAEAQRACAAAAAAQAAQAQAA